MDLNKRNRPHRSKPLHFKPDPARAAKLREDFRRFLLIHAAKKFADDYHANPPKRFEELEQRVKDLSRCLDPWAEGNGSASSSDPNAAASAQPATPKRQPGVRKPKSSHAAAYEIMEDGGTWADVWKRMRDKFPSPESRTKLREAYKSWRRRRTKG